MIIGRICGYIFICLMIMVLGAEGLRVLEGRTSGWITVPEIFELFSSDQIGQLGEKMEQSYLSGFWQDILTPLLNIPAVLIFLFFGLALIIMSRNRLY